MTGCAGGGNQEDLRRHSACNKLCLLLVSRDLAETRIDGVFVCWVQHCRAYRHAPSNFEPFTAGSVSNETMKKQMSRAYVGSHGFAMVGQHAR